MNTEKSVCASSDKASRWDQLCWPEHERKVRRLQARIVKATKERRWGRVKSLQWLLTHSFSGRALAVKRVTTNQGAKTPGVDGATWQLPATRYKAIGSLRRRGYRPQPLRRVYIPKSNGKLSPARRFEPCVRDGGHAYLRGTVVLGAASTSEQEPGLDRQTVLAAHRAAVLGVCRGRSPLRDRETDHPGVGAGLRGENPASYQGLLGCESVRPRMARLLRDACASRGTWSSRARRKETTVVGWPAPTRAAL